MSEGVQAEDVAISFSNGGDLTVHGFRVDVPSPDVAEAEIAALFVASLGLLMTGTIELNNVAVFAEPSTHTRAAIGRWAVSAAHDVTCGFSQDPPAKMPGEGRTNGQSS